MWTQSKHECLNYLNSYIWLNKTEENSEIKLKYIF